MKLFLRICPLLSIFASDFNAIIGFLFTFPVQRYKKNGNYTLFIYKIMNTTSNLNGSTPIWQLTVDQFRELIGSCKEKETVVSPDLSVNRRYVKGLRGIISLFGCSKPTAMKLKNSIIKDAVMQNGKVIITDAEKAIQLFKNYEKEHGYVVRIPSL